MGPTYQIRFFEWRRGCWISHLLASFLFLYPSLSQKFYLVSWICSNGSFTDFFMDLLFLDIVHLLFKFHLDSLRFECLI